MPVGCSSESAACAYCASNDVDIMSVALPARTPNWPSWPIASAGAVPWSVRGSCGASATARNGLAFSCSLRVQIAVQPAVARALHARRAALHVVLRVEVRPRVVVRAARVDDRQLAALEERLERRHARVQAEEAVEVDRAVRARSGSAIAIDGRAL